YVFYKNGGETSKIVLFHTHLISHSIGSTSGHQIIIFVVSCTCNAAKRVGIEKGAVKPVLSIDQRFIVRRINPSHRSGPYPPIPILPDIPSFIHKVIRVCNFISENVLQQFWRKCQLITFIRQSTRSQHSKRKRTCQIIPVIQSLNVFDKSPLYLSWCSHFVISNFCTARGQNIFKITWLKYGICG